MIQKSSCIIKKPTLALVKTQEIRIWKLSAQLESKKSLHSGDLPFSLLPQIYLLLLQGCKGAFKNITSFHFVTHMTFCLLPDLLGLLEECFS